MHGILNSNVSLATARSYWKRKFHVTPFSVPVRLLVYQYTKRSTFARRLWYHNRATSRFCLFVVVVVVVSLGYIIVVCVGDIQ
jgi:hypothetical protein